MSWAISWLTHQDNQLRERLKVACNQAKQAINRARSTYIQTRLNSNLNSPRNFWGDLKKLLPGKKAKATDPVKIKLKDENDELLTNEQSMADFANDYFTNVGAKLVNAIPELDSDNENDYFSSIESLFSDITCLNEFEPIKLTELEWLVKQIDTSKASNIPGIKNSLFKCLLDMS